MIFQNVSQYWKDLSVSKKLYTVVGLMAFLILTELFTLKYTVNILSAVRAFVGGEGHWSKAEKNALLEIQSYIIFRDEKYHKAFLEQLDVNMGDRAARLELMKPNPDLEVVTQGFIRGKNHPQDIPGMTDLILKYHSISYLSRAIDAWNKADIKIDELLSLESEIHTYISSTPRDQPLLRQPEFLQRLSVLNVEVTELANGFTSALGEASRWVEGTLFLILVLVILSVESTGLFLTFKYSQTLLRSLKELNTTANRIGLGELSQRAPVHSHDELGQLALALNQMAHNLGEISGEKNQAEKANQIKSLFLANMSHEIRTPLGAILGFIDLLKEKNLPEDKRKQYLDIISRTGHSLATIINDILDLSKVEAGKIEITKEVFSLSQLMRDLELLLKLRGEDKGIEFSIEAAPNTPEMIYSDPMRLRQILMNIIGNAIKFTSNGSVRVSYEVRANSLIFHVRDTGPGIKEIDVDKLFTLFSQGDTSIRKAHSGTGLGLVLSRKLAQLLGGDVKLENTRVGSGSVFSIEIACDIPQQLFDQRSPPKNKPLAQSEHKLVQNQLQGCRVLLVEDTIENQILISHILERNGLQVKVVGDGQQALDITARESFDVILMDMQMPVLDGYSATAQLRERGYTKPIISLTAHAMREDLKRCLDVGCNETLTKPISQAVLVKTIQYYCPPKMNA